MRYIQKEETALILSGCIPMQGKEYILESLKKQGYTACSGYTDKQFLNRDYTIQVIATEGVYQSTTRTNAENVIRCVADFDKHFNQTTPTERNPMNPFRLLIVQNATETEDATILDNTTILARTAEDAKITLMQNHPDLKLSKVTIYCQSF